MLQLDLEFPTPAENLACDEALLDWCEEEPAREALRFWESKDYFVVVGYGNKVATEVDVKACEQDGVPILRRCTGGGTVLQGPGCLNYSLILNFERRSDLGNITSANCAIMKRNAKTIASLLNLKVSVEGHADLAIGNRKFSGNAQRRRRTHLLFHGTFLLNFDLEKIERYLRSPSREPDYRAHRSHARFLMCLNVPTTHVKRALASEWQAVEESSIVPNELIQELVATKYSRHDWNRKF